jgi:oligopeptide transport system ATP-binding protein
VRTGLETRSHINLDSVFMNTPLLETRDLCVDLAAGGIWGERSRVLDHVTISVDPGEIRGIVGESGCGKTTLARCSLRLIEPSSGIVLFDGVDLASLNGAELRRKRQEFQMVFQDPYGSLNPAMSVEQIILEPLLVHGIGSPEDRKDRLRELMGAVSLDEALAKREPGELSGGQQQRVGIARGLALRPRLLIADEPVSALDVSVQAQVLNLLSDLKRRYGLTLILISHSLYVIHYLCTHVSVMYRGRIVEEASSGVFFKGPKHPYSRALMESMPGLDLSVRRSAASLRETDPKTTRTGCAFHPLCPNRISVCSEQPPRLKEVAPGEKVSCWRF